jgi:hypothetical protein
VKAPLGTLARLARGGQGSQGGSHARGRTCSNCKSALATEQDWCTQCGERNERSMAARAGWYSAGALIMCAVFASGAAAAGVAALTQGSAKEPPHQRLIAQTPPSTPVTPPPTAPVTPGHPETLKLPPAHGASGLGTAATTTTTSTASTASARAGGTAAPGSSTTSTATSSSATSTATSSGPEPIELHTQDLSRYDPGNASPATLGNVQRGYSSRHEEGQSVPYWTFTEPPGHSQVGAGVLIDLHKPTRVGSIELLLSPGFALEVLGANGSRPTVAPPAGGWTLLGSAKAKHEQQLRLRHGNEGFRYLLLWVKHVPNPAKYSIEEFVLETP